MTTELFEELIESVKQGGRIIRKEMPAARTWPIDQMRKDVERAEAKSKYLCKPNRRITYKD
jgi:hypothetical protein